MGIVSTSTRRARTARRTASDWHEILSRFGRSGLSARAFCARESLSLSSFHRWQKRLEAEGNSPAFVPVVSSDDQMPAFWSIEIEMPDGGVIRVRG